MDQDGSGWRGWPILDLRRKGGALGWQDGTLGREDGQTTSNQACTATALQDHNSRSLLFKIVHQYCSG